MAPVYYLKSMMSGLNNQRMGLVGLIVHAAKNNAKASLPLEVVDFSPMKGRTPKDYGRLRFDEVFDANVLLGSLAGEFITSEEPNEVIGLDTCFAIGHAALSEARTQDTDIHRLAKASLLHLQPALGAREQADQIAAWLPVGTMALQLRIEQDWQEYLLKKFGTTEVDTDKEFFTVDTAKIAGKVAASGLPTNNLWLCCDEADLNVPLDKIRDDFSSRGMNVFFKLDLPDRLQFPNERIKRAFLEHAVCQRLDGFIGLSLSTFSQTLWLENQWADGERKHYVYNSPGSTLLKR